MNSNSNPLSFSSLGLKNSLLSIIDSLKYTTPTPIQAETIPEIFKRRDILAQSQTGTGKTAAFALPLLSMIEKSESGKNPKILVITPTRELAAQVSDSFKVFSKKMFGITVLPIYGGQSYTRQIQVLKSGANIVVGTVGRIVDHMKKGTLVLENLSALVLDEADEMLKIGFLNDIQWILSRAPESCQRLLFSATIPNDIKIIIKKHLRNPCKIVIKPKNNPIKIKQTFLVIKTLNKIDSLDRILEVEDTNGVIIFVRTKSLTTVVSDSLKSKGYLAAPINGDIQQSQREKIIYQLKSNQINILVATDVAARGLDIDHISHVINYDFPQDNESYVHRVGRTGRAGREGKAISFIYRRDIRQLKSLERTMNYTLEEIFLPSSSLISKNRIEKFKSNLHKIISSEDLSKFKKLVPSFQLDDSIKMEDIVASLIFLAQGNKKLFLNDDKDYSYRNSSFDKYNRDKFSDEKKKNKFNSSPSNKRSYSSNDGQYYVYRLEMGKNDGLTVIDILQSFFNTLKISKKLIGNIKISKSFSTINLSRNIFNYKINSLKTLSILGKELPIKKL